MSNPYVGEIRMFAGNFAPQGWALCAGQNLPISENLVLFSLLGTTYGGDGQSTFGLPNLVGRIPIHQASNYFIGQVSGSEQVTLTVDQIPAHNHLAQGQGATGTKPGPGGNVWASSGLGQYSTGPQSDAMNGASLAATGGSQPHENMMPYLAVNFIIALAGTFPSRN